jgi:hypothetical protein
MKQITQSLHNVFVEGAGDNREKAIVWALIAIPFLVLVLILGKY